MSAIEMDFLLPNGFIVRMTCDKISTLRELRAPLWEKAVELPAANLLRNSDAYVFIGVTVDAAEVQFDDSSHIGDLQLIYPAIEVSEPKRDSRRLSALVAEAMGMRSQHLDSLRDDELQSFRQDIRQMCYHPAMTREKWTQEERALFHYPPILDINPDLPMNTVKQFKNCNYTIKIRVWNNENGQMNSCDIQVDPTCLPSEVILTAVSKNCRQRSLSNSMTSRFIDKSTAKYVLNVRGKEEYMLKECCIHMYKYIRDCIGQNTVPELTLVSRDALFKMLPDNSCVAVLAESQRARSPDKESFKSSWELPNDKYIIKIVNLPVRKTDHPNLSVWFIQAQLFHGMTPLSPAFSTLDYGYKQELDFDILIQNIPRCARLCFTICASSKYGKGDNTQIGVYWANMQVFNHTGELVVGDQTLGVWRFCDGQSPTIYPQGTPGGNTDPNAQVLRFTVVRPQSCKTNTIKFPTKEEIDETIRREEQFSEYSHEPVSFEKLDKIMAIDPIRELTTEYQKFLWQNRWLAMVYSPNILPRVLQCVNWKDRSAVFELYTMLRKWPRDDLSLSTVLQLLNCQYPDTRVRSLAVYCLDKQITDQLLELFLLQLVQALKFESYMHNELCRYLLYKALLNKTIGHTFFWLLRSELEQPVSKQRFAPILEAYCSHCGKAILNKLIHDVKILNREVEIAVAVKKQSSLGDQTAALHSLLEEENSKVLNQTTSMFDQTVQLGNLSKEKCSVLCSKKRPLWLSWKNNAPQAENTDMEKMDFIFKHGDDLRQDMMVLRLITVMDMVWKYSCHDYRLIKYGCLAMGEEIGMIEVVKNARTVNEVRKALNSYALNEWIHNENRDRYSEAVKTFTYSCAGYCVASFVLGLKDRHPDNIMVTKRGQVFHIDFGHITNHAKRKLGFKRERVPFILTEEFIQVITMGNKNPKTTNEFRQFVFLCFEAYMQLRRNSGLFLTLLSLMMHCNLPELSERADIDEIRNALAIDKSDGEATRYFLGKFDDAYGGSWTTQFDWFLHEFNMLMKKGTNS